MLKVMLIFICVLIMAYCIEKMFPDAKSSRQKKMDLAELYGVILILFLCCFYRHYVKIKIFTSIFCSIVVWVLIEWKTIQKVVNRN